MAQFGTGTNLLGGDTSALQAAMASRGVDSSVLNQQSPASMGGAPTMPTGIGSNSPSMSASPVAAVGSSNSPTQASGASTSSSEAELIIKALSGRLRDLSGMQKNISVGSNQPIL